MMDLAKKKAEKGSPVEDCVLCDQVEMYFWMHHTLAVFSISRNFDAPASQDTLYKPRASSTEIHLIPHEVFPWYVSLSRCPVKGISALNYLSLLIKKH